MNKAAVTNIAPSSKAGNVTNKVGEPEPKLATSLKNKLEA